MWVSADAHDLAISPDGKTIVFTVQERGGAPCLWVRRLDQLDGVRLRGAVGAMNPFVSPIRDGSTGQISISVRLLE